MNLQAALSCACCFGSRTLWGAGRSWNSSPLRTTAAPDAAQAGIEAHDPEPGRYDIIWLQWAALYLTDGEQK